MHYAAKYVQIAVLLVLMLTLAQAGYAQVSTGTISGSVVDPTGAVVAGATVTATNLGTNLTGTVQSNASGLFTIPNLQAGNYRVAITAPGFSSLVISDLTLDVGEQQAVNFSLKIGSATEKIEVTAAAPELDLVSAVTMPVVNEKTIVELPLNGRDWASLANLQPGVSAVRTQSVVAVSNQRANRGVGNQLTVSGARPQMNNYRIDGISINDYSNGGPGGVIGSNLGVDAIQEFSVITGNATADYGKTAGGIINAVTRTGSNRFHGDVYEFFRNSALDARNEFDPVKIPPLRRNQFGASAGGPLVRDRTFLFGDYEGLRWFNSTSASSNVLSQNAHNGLLVCNQPATGTQNPNCLSSAGGSQAPAGSSGVQQYTIDAAVKPYLQFYPLPNSTVSGDTGTFLFADPFRTSENYFTIRADHKLSGSNQLAATYFWDNGTLTAPDAFNEKITGNIDKRQMASLSLSHTFTPTLLNTLHLGYSRVVSDAPTTLDAIFAPVGDTSLGFVPNLPVGLINIGAVSNFTGGLHAVGEFLFHYNSYQLYDDVYWSHGKHSVKTGFAFERLQNNQMGTSNPNGQFNFANIAGFLQNQPTGFNAPIGQTTSPKDLRQSVIAGYVTDDYHFSSKLTVNLGVRYEFATVPSETAGRLSNLPTLTSATPHTGSPYFQNPTKRNFAPRVGFSYAPYAGDRTVFHAAFGIYNALPLNYLFEGLSIFSAPFFQSGSVSTASALLGTFPKNAYPLLTPATFRYSYTTQNPKASYVEQYALNVQQQITKDLVTQLGYQGSHGVHLAFREDDINTVQPIANLGGGNYEFPSLLNNLQASTVNPRLNPNVGQISAMLPVGGSNYNSLQASLSKRLSHRFQLQLSYTWAKSIDDGSSSTFGDSFANSVSSLPFFAKDVRHAVSDFNIGHNFVFNYLILLPDAPRIAPQVDWALKGWQYGGIFQMSSGLPITPLISGDPLGLRSSDTFDFPNRVPGCKAVNPQNRSHYINTACYTYPTSTAAYNPILGNSRRNSINGPGLQNFDMSLVKNNRVPWLGETFNVQFRAELFNIFNRVNYANPLKASSQLFAAAPAPTAANPTPSLVGSLNTSSGALTATATTARQTQFALKIIF
ncbi:MAG: carboxypeptidase regulatory-like domain-containing protein [Acidobacteriota bacterium]|nr:carboxypeptidase regulatory-like domain-containing protein [Acidobacteriota bacterium]